MTANPTNPSPDDELREKLAAIEHERWADWQKWVHKCLRPNPVAPGSFPYLLDVEWVERWDKQIDTPYKDLSEAEKQSDREQVDRYWPLIEKFIFDRLADEMAAYQKSLRADYEEDMREARIEELEALDHNPQMHGDWQKVVEERIAQLQAEQPTKEETTE